MVHRRIFAVSRFSSKEILMLGISAGVARSRLDRYTEAFVRGRMPV